MFWIFGPWTINCIVDIWVSLQDDGRWCQTHLGTTAIHRTLVFVITAALASGWFAVVDFTSIEATVKMLQQTSVSHSARTLVCSGTHSASSVVVTDAIKEYQPQWASKDRGTNISCMHIIPKDGRRGKDCSLSWGSGGEWVNGVFYIESKLAWEAISKVTPTWFSVWREHISSSFVQHTGWVTELA